MNTTAEAHIICHYLLGRPATAKVVELYQLALLKHPLSLNAKETVIWKKCMRHPILLSLTDAALAVKNPQSGIRKRIFACLAILEAQPEYARFFLPAPQGRAYLISLFFTGLWALIKRWTGTALLWIL